jgi:uncharacterized protein (TIGR00661 family)
MKILYGVQGTGNGHVSRARAMARHFAARGTQVDYLFSGRTRESYFEMEAFGNFDVRSGLTFAVEAGRVNYLKTTFKNNPLTFVREVASLDVAPYDLILCDFEPVTGWAGKLKKKKVIGFGHQPAFRCKIPMEGEDLIAKLVMKHFAPADINIGLHWHHFDQPILPPIIHVNGQGDAPVQENKVLVYLPFDTEATFAPVFSLFTDHEFYFYHPDYKQANDVGNLHRRPLSVQLFQDDLQTSAAVICGAGFELPSECIQFGKKLLVKPVKNQMEQASNAVALVQLGLGQSMKELDVAIIKRWLQTPNANNNRNYPDVAKALVNWILAGEWQDYSQLQKDLWDAVAV